MTKENAERFLVGTGKGFFKTKEILGPEWSKEPSDWRYFDYDEAVKVAANRHRWAQVNSLKGITEIVEEVDFDGEVGHQFVLSFSA